MPAIAIDHVSKRFMLAGHRPRGLKGWLVERLRGRVSGLCQPHYMLDIPGGFGKVPIEGAVAEADGRYKLRDFRGVTHLYPPGV